MENHSGKILKILLFFGVFAYLLYYDYSRDAFKFGTITGGLMMASAVYLIASLFGIILNLSRNYIIAIFGTGALALFFAFKLDEIIAKVSWLNETIVAVILIIFAILCIAKDFSILKPKQAISPYSPNDFADTSIPLNEVDLNQTMRENMKANPQSVLNLSNMLEEQWGRKPTYDEVMDYIDHLVIPENEEEYENEDR
ncbi:MAG: hypothetical protein ACOCNC_04740 [Acetivibrio ethanolgignens]